MKTVTVMNVLNEQKQIFHNGYDLETNLISAIIYSSEDRRKILDDDYRNYITELAKVEYIKSLNGTNKVYSPVFDMISYEC
tara:strand:+ start:1100 stop:1342 length:243 start_codon:yes stop_codon:yes gene_type:complete